MHSRLLEIKRIRDIFRTLSGYIIRFDGLRQTESVFQITKESKRNISITFLSRSIPSASQLNWGADLFQIGLEIKVCTFKVITLCSNSYLGQRQNNLYANKLTWLITGQGGA